MNNGQSAREIRAYFTAGYWPLNCPAKHNGTIDPSRSLLRLLLLLLLLYVSIYRRCGSVWFSIISSSAQKLFAHMSYLIILFVSQAHPFVPAKPMGGNERDRQRERVRDNCRPPAQWRPAAHLVVTKFYKNCWKCVANVSGKVCPSRGDLGSYGIFSFLLPSTITCSLHRTHPHTHNAINCDK